MIAKKIKTEIVYCEFPKNKKFINITGNTYERITVIGYAGNRYWYCKCICENIIKVFSGSLYQGFTKSCGCLNSELSEIRRKTHGESLSIEYASYCSAKGRCNNPNNPKYKSYGERGIKFLFTSFESFIKELGNRPSVNHSLDRIDVNGNYELGNVRWATPKQQGRNTRFNKLIEIDGITKCQSEWAEIYGNIDKRIHHRIYNGWCNDCAVKLPVGKSCSHKITFGKTRRYVRRSKEQKDT